MSDALAEIRGVVLTGLEVGGAGIDRLQPMEKALLVGLLLRRNGLNQAASRLWAWPDPGSVTASLVPKKVSSLRRAGCDVSSGRGGAPYTLLNLDFEAVDAHRFVAEHRRGRELLASDASAATAAWEGALRLWTPYVPLADRHPYVQCPAEFDKWERAYRDLLADLCGALLDQPGDARRRAAELVDLLAEAAPEDKRLARLREAVGEPGVPVGTPAVGPDITRVGPVGQDVTEAGPDIPAVGQFEDGPAEEAYVAEYARRCAMVDPRHIRRSQLTQDVIVPLDDVYVALSLNVPDPGIHWAEEVSPEEEPDGRTEPGPLGEEGSHAVLALAATGVLDAVGGSHEPGAVPGESSATGVLVSSAPHPVIELVDLIREKRWAVILGDPGAGKSTLLQWLALIHAKTLVAGKERVVVPGHRLGLDTEEVDLGPARLPVLVRVADYAEHLRRETDQNTGKPSGLLDFLGMHPLLDEPLGGSTEVRSALIRARLRAGRTIVLLDGLDEIADHDLRIRVRQDIESFVSDHITDPQNPSALNPWQDSATRQWWRVPRSAPAESGGNQLVVTSRVGGYRETALDSRYTLARIKPLTPAMIRRFCTNWCLAVQRFRALTTRAPDEAIQRLAAADAEKLNTAIQARPGVARIATNPLLLTVLATLLREGGRLPTQRIGVYLDACGALVERRQSTWSLEDVVEIMGPLALWLHEHRSNGVATLDEVRSRLAESMPRVVGANDPDSGLPGLPAYVDDFLTAARQASGLLLEVSEDRFRFLHLTFQEFLAACELTRSLDGLRSHLGQRLHDPRWLDVSAMAMALVCKNRRSQIESVLDEVLNAGSAHEDIVHRDLLFVAHCLTEMPYSLPKPVSTVTDALIAAGTEAESRGYLALAGRIRDLLRALHEAQPRLVLPRLVNALHDPVKAAFPTDVCAVLDAPSAGLLEGLDAACRRWDRSPRAVAIRADVARQLRDSGQPVDPRFTPIGTLVDSEYAGAARLLAERVPQVATLLRKISGRVDPALRRVVGWFLEGVRGQGPAAPADIADRLLDGLLEECRLALGADFSALTAVAYDLAPQRAKQWLRDEFRAERVDLLSAARLFMDLPAFLPGPAERDAWFAGLSDLAARALLSQTPPPDRERLLTALAWQRLRADRSSETTAHALALLRRVCTRRRFIELTLDAIPVLSSFLRTGTDEERQSARSLLPWLALPAAPSDELTDRLEEIALGAEDEFAVLADILLARVHDRQLTPRRYDVLAGALLNDGGRLRQRAFNALNLQRDAGQLPVETVSRSIAHEKRLIEAGDLPSATAHSFCLTNVVNASLEWTFSVCRDRELSGPMLSPDAAAEGLLRIAGMTETEAARFVDCCDWFNRAQPPLGLDLTRLGDAVEELASDYSRRGAMTLFAAEATVVGRAQVVTEWLNRPHDPELTAVGIRDCAAQLHRHEHNWPALAALRDIARNALTRADCQNPRIARQFAGVLALLDLLDGAAPDRILAMLTSRTAGDASLVQALVWAMSGQSATARTRSGALVSSVVRELGDTLGASPRGMEALIRQAGMLLGGAPEEWDHRRTALTLLEAAADRAPGIFVKLGRAGGLADRLAVGAQDSQSFSVRQSSLYLGARLEGGDASFVARLVLECRDIDILRQQMVRRLEQSPPQGWTVEPAHAQAVIAGGHLEAALLTGAFLIRAARNGSAPEQTTSWVAGLFAARVRTGDALAQPMLGLLDELLVIGSGYSPAPAGLERWATETALLHEHRSFGNRRRGPWFGRVAGTDSMVTVVTARLPLLVSVRATTRTAPPQFKGHGPTRWTDLGFPGELTVAETNLLTGAVYDLGEIRVGVRLSRRLDSDQRRRFEEAMEADDEPSALALLESVVPDYREEVRRVFSVLYDEVRQHSVELLALLRSAEPGEPAGER
ncbi:DUF5663 domain-containing protein [Streptomyces coeruleorubidus]|uniref:DUF5663 domain-containing protein n=1 Tax=Streptomyces coeruleorubidus TaxID=116188 RepID=UPI0033AE7085